VRPLPRAWLGPVSAQCLYPGCWPDRGRGAPDGFLGDPHILGHPYDAAQTPVHTQVKSHVLYCSRLPGFFYLLLSFLEPSIPDALFLGPDPIHICDGCLDFSEIEAAICRCFVGN